MPAIRETMRSASGRNLQQMIDMVNCRYNTRPACTKTGHVPGVISGCRPEMTPNATLTTRTAWGAGAREMSRGE